MSTVSSLDWVHVDWTKRLHLVAGSSALIAVVTCLAAVNHGYDIRSWNTSNSH